MANLTIAIDERLLQRARIRALQQGTTVNAVLREYLESYAGHDPAVTAEILEASRRSTSRRSGRAWTRDELHER